MIELLRIPFDRPFLQALARDMLRIEGDGLPAATVLLPSSRAVRTLRQELLAASGRDALLLPDILTPGQLVGDLADRLGFDLPPFPAALRSEWLARALMDLPWLEKNRESAPGLAAELVALFDDMRRHGLDPADPAAEREDLLLDDVDHVRDAWARYRPLIPWDDVDREISVTGAAETAERWPGRPFGEFWIAGFVDLPPVRARLLRAAAKHARRTVIAVSITADGGAAADLISTFATPISDHESDLHPASPALTVVRELDLGDLPERMTDHPPRPTPAPTLTPCFDPEDESRRITAVVVEHLRADPGASIAVATGDTSLARRVAAQLRDTGLDFDDTGGVPLSSTGAGRLAWLLMRCAVTGPAHEPLIELLTHPMATFGHEFGPHRGRTRSFERSLLRGQTAPGSLDGYRTRAVKHDDAMEEKLQDTEPKLTPLVDDVAHALTPLLDVSRGAHDLGAILSALRTAWERAAPDAPLDADQPDRRTLDQLLGALDDAAVSTPPTTLADAAAMLTRLMGAETVRPHRAEHKPVQITGLLEARLETFDLVVLGGMTEERFPGRVGRPLYLGRAWREAAGLPDWRRTMGQQAELFARLLHAGDRVVVTWPGEVDGQPTLPSPFVQRLALAGHPIDAPGERPVLYRRAPDVALPVAPRPTPLDDTAPTIAAPLRPITAISPSALSMFRNCPYRWLLARGYGLDEEDQVREALQSRDQGTIVHDCMAAFLEPEGPGVLALEGGRLDEARRLLADIAAEQFRDKAGDLPQHRIWEASFLAGADALVDFEHRRLAQWRPAAVEEKFEVPLGTLADAIEADVGLTPEERAVPLRGQVDRVDQARDGSPRHFVIDYKTGSMPSKKDVTEGRDLQLAAYALAVNLGGVNTLVADAATDVGVFYALKSDAPGFRNPFPLDQLERDAETILTTARTMLRAEGEAPLVPDETGRREPPPCRYCHLRGICRLDERDLSVREEVAG